jgi:hypothetical protein
MPLRRSSASPGPASAPRAATADPFAHAVFRSSAATGLQTKECWNPRKPRPTSEWVMRRLEFHRRRRSATRAESRGPAGTLVRVPAALMGFVPSQCCSCPRGFGGVVRPVVSHLPFRDPRRPDNFRRGIGRASRDRSRSAHPRYFGRQPIEGALAAAPGLGFPSRAIRAVDARVLWRARLSLVGGRDCLGLCLFQVFGALSRCSDGLDPAPGRQASGSSSPWR